MTMTSRIRPVTVLDEDEEEESVLSSDEPPTPTTPTVDRMMESFTQELDGMMEQGPDLHEMIERAKRRAEQSYHYHNNNSRANTGGRGGVEPVAYQQQQQPQYVTVADPYANRSRPTEDYRDTPDMRTRRTGNGGTPDSRRTIHMPTQTQTTTPQEPKPVRTSPYQRQSPLPAAAAPVGYSTRLEDAVDPERGRYESSSRRPPVRAQEVNSMQPPTPTSGSYGTRRFEGDADPEHERRTFVRAQEANNMQSPTPGGYSTTRFEGDADPEHERRTSVRAQEANSMQSPTPGGYGTTRFEGDADPERERRTYNTRAEELQMQSPAALNGYSTRVLEGDVVDGERENYENSSKRTTTSKRVEANDRGGDTNTNNNLPPLSSVKLILDSMGNTMERQESRIRFLEEENEALRAEIDYCKRDQMPASTTRSSPHPEPAYSAPLPRSHPANSNGARSPLPVPVREPGEQNNISMPPTRRTPQPASSSRSPMREPWEQRSAPPSTSRSASKQSRSPMPEAWEHSARPSRNPGPGPQSFHLSSEETRHSSPPTRSPNPDLWDHQTAPPMRSLGPVMHDRSREFMSPAAYRRPEGDVVSHRTFSPGTKFVAELSNVMELEEGYHAPLSALMDKYWDRIDQVRNGHGWDR